MLQGTTGLLDAYRQIAEDIGRQVLVTNLTEGKRGEREWRKLEVRSKK